MDVYHKLARKIDKWTNGYPATKSGVEIKILKRIFTEEDAEVALKLWIEPEPVKKIAKRLGKSEKETTRILDAMAEKGQIGSFTNSDRVQIYSLFPFILGIWEFQVDKLDRELADLFDEYAPDLVKKIGGHKPAMTRVVPINTSIPADLQVLNYEDMRGMMNQAKSFQLMDCICRKKKTLQNDPCKQKHTLKNCMVFFKTEKALDYFHFGGEVVSKEKALEVLEQTEKEGLVHCTYNTRNQVIWVCNCCPCCCDLLIGLNEYKSPYLLTRSNYFAEINEETCSECGVCAKKRCPVEAISNGNGPYRVDRDRCIGCGVCVPFCKTESISFKRRPKNEIDIPPANIAKWHQSRWKHRSVEAVKNKLMGH